MSVFAARTVKLPPGAEPGLAEPRALAAPTERVVPPQATVPATTRPAAAAQPTTAVARPTATQSRATMTPAAVAVATQALRTPMATTIALATTSAVVTPSGGPTATVAAAIPGEVAVPVAAAHGPNGEVALTFDAGADRGYAEDILDILQAQHVVASFGITGVWARANPELVRRMAADGHLVINHTLDHRSFTGVSDKLGGLSAARRRAELDDADAIIAPLIGHSTHPWYRLPYGDDDAQVAADVAPDGYVHKVGWTIDSLGWRGSPSSDILARCLKLAAPGAVYVLHVGRASQDAIALPQLIAGLRDRGFAFRRVDQA